MRDHNIDISTNNYWPMVLEGSLFFGGVMFMAENTVLPMFINTYGGSMALIGTLIMLHKVISQLCGMIVGPYIPYIKNLPRYITIVMSILRPLPIIVMPALLLLGASNTVLIVAFFIVYIGVWAGNGLSVTGWADIFARTIYDSKRSDVYGNQLFIGGLLGVLCGLIVTYCMGRTDITSNVMFTLLFASSGVILTASVYAMSRVRDDNSIRDVKVIQGSTLNIFKEYYMGIPSYWKKSKDFRTITYSRLLNAMGIMLFPFIYLMAKDIFKLTPQYLAILVSMNIAGSILSGISWRLVGKRWGHRGIIVISQYMVLIVPMFLLLALVFKDNIVMTFIILSLVQILMGHIFNNWMGYSNYLFQVVSKEDRAKYLVFSGIIRLPLAVFALLGGIIVETQGYWALVNITILAAIAGIFLSHRMPKKSFEDQS
jgi:hypothetical protein